MIGRQHSVSLQDTTTFMSREQLQVFWDHFKILDKDMIQYAKPPASWKPPAVRDMTHAEADAYWKAFSCIMERKITQMPENSDTHDSLSNDDASEDKGEAEPDSDKSPTPGSTLSKPPPPPKRLRCKTSPAMIEALSMKLSQQKLQPTTTTKQIVSSTARPKACSSQQRQKRKYVQKTHAKRTGKRHCVPIWTKVKLFEESWTFQHGTLFVLNLQGSYSTGGKTLQ